MAAVCLRTAAHALAIAIACKSLMEGRIIPDQFIMHSARAIWDGDAATSLATASTQSPQVPWPGLLDSAARPWVGPPSSPVASSPSVEATCQLVALPFACVSMFSCNTGQLCDLVGQAPAPAVQHDSVVQAY